VATTRATELGQLAKLVTVDSNGNSVITGTFDATLPASGVVAGVHGSASSVPIMSVTAQGLIDSVGSAPINTATSLSFDSATGQLTLGFSDTSTISQTLTLDPFTTDNLTEGSNLYYSDARFDSAFGVKTTADLTEGSNLYYTDVRFDSAFGDKSTNDLTEGDNLYYTQGRFDSALGDKTTDNLTEGSNLYYTTARADSDAKAAISVTDAGGDGSLTYSAGTITYTGPSASEVRAHFSGGTGVDISSGVVSIGQNVDSSSNVIFQSLETTGNVTVGGNLQVNGATTTVSSQNLSIEDNMLYLNQLESDGSPTIEVDVGFAANVNDTGTYAHTGFFRDATDATWKLFDGYTPEPDSDLDIDINHASFEYADLQVADLTAGNITVSGTVDGRDVAADGTKLDGIENGATGDQTKADIDALNINADQVDGLEASQFLRNDTNGTSTGSVAFGNIVLDPDSYSTSSGGFGNIQDGGGWAARGLFITGGTGKAAAMASGSGNVYLGTQDGSNAGSMATWLQVAQSTKVADFKANPTVNANAIWHAGNDGSGSGLDADTVDGVQLSGLVQRDFQDTNRNLNIATNSTSSAGLFMKASDGGFRFQIYGDGTSYGFLDGDWAAWDLKKTTNGALYFNDNNSYYLNPPGYSLLDRLHVGGSAPYTGGNAVYSDERMSLSVGDAGLEAIVYQSQYNNATYPDYGMVFVHGASGGNRNVWAIAPEGPARGDKLSFLYNLNSTNIHTGTYRFWLDGSGNSYSQTSSRSPIFYDSNNTSYYTNPGDSTTSAVMNGKIVVGSSASIEGGGSNTYGVFRGYQNSNHYIAVRGIVSTSGAISGGHHTTFVEHMSPADDTTGWFFKTNAIANYPTIARISYTSSWFRGILYGADSVRSPIFYDNNNTAYYFHGDSTSNVNRLNANRLQASNNSDNQGLHFRSDNETISGEGWCTAAYNYNNNDGFLFLARDTGGTAHPSFHIGGYNNAGYGPWSDADSMITLVRHNGTKSTGSSYADKGLSNSSDYSNIVKTTAKTIFRDADGIHEFTGNIRATIFYDQANTAYYFDGSATGDSIRVAGDIVAYYSDERLKDREGNISGAIDKISKLNGFYYRANKKAQELGYDTRLQVGVSAQEVEAVLPEVVKDAPIGQGYKTVKYDRMVPLLIEAIKEQQEIINKQSQDIDELKQLVKQLMENK